MIRGARLEKQCPNFPLYFLYYLPEAAKFVEEAAGERTNQSCYRFLPKIKKGYKCIRVILLHC